MDQFLHIMGIAFLVAILNVLLSALIVYIRSDNLQTKKELQEDLISFVSVLSGLGWLSLLRDWVKCYRAKRSWELEHLPTASKSKLEV